MPNPISKNRQIDLVVLLIMALIGVIICLSFALYFKLSGVNIFKQKDAIRIMEVCILGFVLVPLAGCAFTLIWNRFVTPCVLRLSYRLHLHQANKIDPKAVRRKQRIKNNVIGPYVILWLFLSLSVAGFFGFCVLQFIPDDFLDKILPLYAYGFLLFFYRAIM